MTPEDIAWLQSADGRDATGLAEDRLAAGFDELRTIEALRRSYVPEQARAALALALGRSAAASKFADAAELFCDRDAAEQAANDLVARHTAQRFRGRVCVADLGCGMGGDLLSLARESEVVAVDRDAGHLAMAAANAAVRGLSDRVTLVEGDAETFADPECDAAWLDPSRRDGNGRALDPGRWSPSLATALEIARRYPAAGIKLAPGIDRDLLSADGEREFIALDGRLVTAVLWLGALVSVSRRATVIDADGGVAALHGSADTVSGRVAPIGGYLYDPSPAVGRAQLIHPLADSLEGWQLDARVAYVSSDRAVPTPFARRFRVLAAFPFSERRLREELAHLGAGRAEVMKRGSPIETNELAGRLDHQLEGDRVLTVALTRVGAESTAIVCERERDADG